MIKEKWIVLFGALIVFLLNLSAGWLFAGEKRLSSLVLQIIILAVMTYLQWLLTYLVVQVFRRKNPKLTDVRKRSINTFFAVMLFAFAWGWLIDIFISLPGREIEPGITPARIINLIIQAILFAFSTIGLLESVYYYRNLRQAETEKDELQKANLQSQFDSLKAQVQPHFLFNSLNSLISLVDEDTARAKKFINKLSVVYRYLLQSNENTLTTLADELKFIQAYFFLLKTRFEEGLELSIQVEPSHNNYLLPPLTLQMLVENAVKHNQVVKGIPLLVKIYSENGDRLTVQNNLQKKVLSFQSGKIGLANISAKYKLLKQPDIIIKESETDFTVTVPLIKNES